MSENNLAGRGDINVIDLGRIVSALDELEKKIERLAETLRHA